MSVRTSALPPVEPMRTFEANLSRVEQLMQIHAQLATGPGKPAQWRSDIAGAAIVMTIAAVDTYFDDRLRADFERQFDRMDLKQVGQIFAGMFAKSDASNPDCELYVSFARAFRNPHPRQLILLRRVGGWQNLSGARDHQGRRSAIGRQQYLGSGRALLEREVWRKEGRREDVP
jgi:hypothetical protein